MRNLEGNLWRYRLFAIVAFTPFFVPIVVLFWKQNGLGMFDIFLLQSVYAIAVVFLEVPTGMVADRLGKRTSLLYSCVLMGLGFAYYAVSASFMAFLIAEILLAIGMSLYSGADSALLYDTLKALDREDEYARFDGQAKAIQLVSVALATLIGGLVGAYSFRVALWMTAIGPVLGFIVAWGFTEANPPTKQTSWREGLHAYRDLIQSASRFVWKQQWVRWQIAMLALLLGSASWLLWLYQPYMKHSGLPIWAFGVAFAIYNLFAAFASHQAYRVEETLGLKKSMVLLAVLQITPLFLMAAFVGPFAFLFVLGHQGVRGLMRPLINNSILRYTYEDKRATVLSMGSMAGRLFFAVTSPLIGWVAARASIETTLLVQAGILIASFALLWFAYHTIPGKYFTPKSHPTTS